MLAIYFRRIGVVIRNRFGPGNDPTWLDEVKCTGKENKLRDCEHNAWGRDDCSHNEDVAVSCNKTLSHIRKLIEQFVVQVMQSVCLYVCVCLHSNC